MKKQLDLTNGKILTTLVRFAVPVFFAMFLQSLYGGVDMLVVGKFAKTADISGVASGSMFLHTLMMLITGMAVGVTVLIGQKIGEKRTDQVGDIIGGAICLFALMALVFTLLCVGFAEAFARLMHAPQEAMKQTTAYIRICGIGLVFIVAYNVLGAIFRGIGDAKTPLVTVAIACAVNIAGDLLFVAVLKMGAAGAALATVMAQGVSVVVSLLMIIKNKNLPFKFSLRNIGFRDSMIKTQIKLGAPIAFQELLVGLSFVVIQSVANSFHVNASAGVGVAEKLCGFIMLVPSAFMQSMATFVSQNRGAGKMDRAKKALFYGIITSFSIGVVIGTFTFIRGDLLAMIFANDSAVIKESHSYLKAYAIDCMLTPFLFCMMGYFNGCGETFFVMLQGIIGAFFVRIPIVLLMSRIPGVSMFMVGLGTPAATIVQISMCVGMFLYLRKKQKY